MAVAVLGSCSPASPTAPELPPLSHTFASADALASAVLDALARSDRATLQQLALSETEFRAHVWPALPASQPQRNVPFEYAWQQLKQRSDAHLADIVARHAGKRYRLSRIGFTGETTQYDGFVVQRESEILAVDEAGREWVLQLFGSVLVKDARYKMFSYVVD